MRPKTQDEIDRENWEAERIECGEICCECLEPIPDVTGRPTRCAVCRAERARDEAEER